MPVRAAFSLARPLLLLLPLLALASCDGDPPRQLPATAPAQPVTDLELRPLTPLLPARPTHVAVDSLGNVYWTQEADRLDDTLFVIGEGAIPRATQLSAGNIAAAMGVSGGRGNIQGIAAGPDGDIYFFFRGGAAARRSMAVLGRYSPKTAKIRVLADTDAIAAATGMGRSLPLARGTLLSDGRFIWAWIRHTDAWALFQIDPAKLAPDGPAALVKAFDAVKVAGKPLPLTRDEYELWPGLDGTLFLLDPVGGHLLRIDAAGNATVARSLAGLPNALSTPAVDRRGQILLFAGNVPESQIIKPTTEDDAAAPKLPEISYPAMLMFEGNSFAAAAERDRIMAYPGFQVYAMRLKHLVPNPTAQEWISYDAGSGELLRLKLRQRLWP
ncbi:MAG TPA: hypothetical protein VER17_07610 [Tepidisphaeraceae bacterium]|nr:hypothetical protein [Tepidisphaeraceae bacterium]